MKIVYNRFIPFRGFFAINLFGTLFVRVERGYPQPSVSGKTINHESIHTEQMKELGYVFFYILYFIEWLVRLITNTSSAYRSISFEREAYGNQDNMNYLNNRKRYSWIKYIVK